MNVVKSLALGLLSFLLFLSISIFGLAFTLNSTILNPDFIVSQFDRLDVSSLTGELFREQITGQIPEELEFITDETIDDILADAEPWLKEQATAAIYTSYDYLLGRSETLSLVIPTEPLKDILKDNLWQALLESPPPEAAGLPPDVLEEQFEQFFQEFSAGIPSTFELNENSIPTEVMTQLEQARQYINYYQIGYKALIGFMALLVIGIILLNRQIRVITRGLGTTLLAYGALGYGGILATKHLVLPRLPLYEIPVSLQAWLPQLYSDLLHPMEIFSIGLLVGGIVLLIVSFVYKPRQASL
ncbi:hypothetical protein ES703_30796 [subsurface metagenome]